MSIFTLQANFQHKGTVSQTHPVCLHPSPNCTTPSAALFQRALEQSKKWATAIEELPFQKVIFCVCNTIHLDCPTVGDSKEELHSWNCLQVIIWVLKQFVSSGHIRDIPAFGAGTNVKLPVTQLIVKHRNIFQHSHWCSLSTDYKKKHLLAGLTVGFETSYHAFQHFLLGNNYSSGFINFQHGTT